MSGTIVKRLTLRRFSVVTSLITTPARFHQTKLPWKLQCHLFSQVGFWVILSFTNKGLCTFIQAGNSASGNQPSEVRSIEPRSQTKESSEKFLIPQANPSNFSRQAKDLVSEESQLVVESVSVRSSLPENLESLTTTQKQLPRSVESPVLPSSQCWRSLPTDCTYSTGNVQVTEETELPPESRSDAELGDLRLSPVPDSELGILQLQPLETDPPVGSADPELGTLRIQERTTPQPPIALPTSPRQPTAYLLARADYFRSSNVFSDIDPVDDGLFRTGLTFFYAPPIGSRTFLITSIDANLIRYTRLGQYQDVNGTNRSLNYDELRFRAGVFHRITRRLSAELGWSNQKLFTSARGLQQVFGGREFFGDNSIRFELSRQDALSPKLSLNTYYQFRWSLANPNDRSRILNTFIATLGYNFSQKLQTAIDYQFSWSHFTQQARDDLYHQLIGRVTYNFTPRTQANLFAGYSFGHSSDSRIDFNSFIFGAGLVFSVPLF
ncbi:hypothetical protein [Leptolyngbya sp. NIES-2104]|uniref:hypothetical protein n=1 Tax=Leptolyngbya sp. NIES-2104 TaxID=1552121 RepID=UPI0012E361BC|nr:hypothetical protein [Leptolyngbya sp. NIES-2104]